MRTVERIVPGLCAVVLIVSVASWLFAGSDKGCVPLASWERAVGSLSPYPEIVRGDYEHVELLICGDRFVEARVTVYNDVRTKKD